MAWPSQRHFQNIIQHAQQKLEQVIIVEYDVDSPVRAILRLEGTWQGYRIIISEIHRPDNTTRYAYYLLTADNQHIHRFDNSADKTALRLRYGAEAKQHIYEEIPHQHDSQRQITLTPQAMTFEMFMQWLEAQ